MNKTFNALLTLGLLLGGTYAAQAQFISNNGITLTNSGVMSTNGDWQNSAETVIVNDGVINTSQAFSNDGIMTTTNGGGFSLDYAAKTPFKPGATMLGFIRLTNVGGVDLTGNIAIKDSLVMNKGSIKIQLASDTITLLDGALVKVQPTSFIDGKVAHVGSGKKVYPLGTSGQAMGLTLHKADVTKATASLIARPVGASPGPGLDSLSGISFCWRVDEKTASDTAAYVELNFPAAFAQVNKAVVARYNGDNNNFSSMGARVTETLGGQSKVVSYSRGLKGIYGVAYGVPVDRVQDSVALRAFYFSTSGDDWTSKNGWITGPVETWQGLEFAGKAIVAVKLPANNLVGDVSERLVDLGAVTTLDLSGNELTSIPDFSVNRRIQSMNVSGNRLTFASLEPNAPVTGLVYNNQQLGDAQDLLFEVNTPASVEFSVGGKNTSYVWKRNGTQVATENTESIYLESINRSNMGAYVVEATNTLFPGFKLTSEVQNLLAYADVSGKFSVDTQGASSGFIRILRVTDEGAYLPTDTVFFNADGSYTFEKVILGDYQLVGFADTLVYEDELPTYYGNTLYWEDATKLAVNDHTSNVDITSISKPGPTTGPGSISGYLEEETEEGGREKGEMVAKRVGGAGGSVRRAEGSGRGKEVLTLVGYTFTDEDGNFSFSGLPNGEYVLNLQYPGYPMDETSDIRLNVADALKSEVMVGARIIDGKINVQKITVTNIYETKDYSIQLYPNPAVDYIKVKFGQKSNGRNMQISDITGQKLLNVPANDVESVMDISTLKRGIYLFQVEENGIVRKTVKVSIE